MELTSRIECCIPFCRRGSSLPKFTGCSEFMCGKHYRLAPKSLRGRRTKILRRLTREFDQQRAQRLFYLQQQLWKRIKIVATNTAMGIG